MQKIPTISFNDLKNRNSDVLEFLTKTLENNGFFIINDHSIDTKLIEKVFSVAEIGDTYVDKKYQGRGFFTDLVNKSENEAKDFYFI